MNVVKLYTCIAYLLSTVYKTYFKTIRKYSWLYRSISMIHLLTVVIANSKYALKRGYFTERIDILP